jgi:copper chaperone CopZ
MDTLKHRTVHVDNLFGIESEETVAAALSPMKGMKRVKADRAKGEVEVVYDLLEVELKDIEAALEKSGFPVHGSMAGSLKSGFVHFTEDNERDNLTSPPPPCCSDFSCSKPGSGESGNDR